MIILIFVCGIVIVVVVGFCFVDGGVFCGVLGILRLLKFVDELLNCVFASFVNFFFVC